MSKQFIIGLYIGLNIFILWRMIQIHKYIMYLMRKASDKDVANFLLHGKMTNFLDQTPRLTHKAALFFWRPIDYYIDPKFIKAIHNLD